MQKKITLIFDGQFYAIENTTDHANHVFHFLNNLAKRGAFDGRISFGPMRKLNAIKCERAPRFAAFAKTFGIETVYR